MAVGYLLLHKKLLWISGVSLNENESVWHKLYSSIVLSAIWIYVLTVFHAIVMTHQEMSLDRLLENVAYLVATCNGMLKISFVFYLRKKLGRTVLLFQGSAFAPKTKAGEEEETKLIKECSFIVNMQIIVILAMVYLNSTLSLITTLVPRFTSESQYWILPFGNFALFDVHSSPSFEIVFVCQYVTVQIAAFGFSIVTTFISGIMAYISYRFKILQNRIRTSVEYSARKLNKSDDGDDDDDNTENQQVSFKLAKVEWEGLKETLQEIVEHHNAIINLAEQFEELLNVPQLFDVIGMSLVICVGAFACSAIRSFNMHLINQLILTVGNIFLNFVTTYWGNEVMTESQSVARACYEVGFVGTDIRFQKALNNIVQRSQRPIQFTVGKFAPLSLQTFFKVLQSAYSYLMMLFHFTTKAAGD